MAITYRRDLNRALTTEEMDNNFETLASGSSTATTTIVTMDSGSILNMGSSPIELLPAPGAGKYYDIDKIVLEYIHNGIAYSTAANLWIGGQKYITIDKKLITTAQNQYLIIDTPNEFIDTTTLNDLERQGISGEFNLKLELTTYDYSNPTSGDGTMRVIITYTTRTFGA